MKETQDTSVSPIPTQERLMTRRTLLRSAGIGLTTFLLSDTINLLRRKMSRFVGLEKVPKQPIGTLIDYFKYDRWDSQLVGTNLDTDRWSSAILSSFEKYCPNDVGIEQKEEYLLLILAIINLETRFRATRRSEPVIPSPTEESLAQAGIRNTTSGPMETHIAMIAKEQGISQSEARKLLTNLESGMDLSLAHFFRIELLYRNQGPKEKRILCILADWNAGEGASAKAGIQHALNSLGVPGPLDEDGSFKEKTKNAAQWIAREKAMEWEGFSLGQADAAIEEFLCASPHDLPSTEFVRFLRESLGADTNPVPANLQIKHALLPNGSSRSYAHNVHGTVLELEKVVLKKNLRGRLVE